MEFKVGEKVLLHEPAYQKLTFGRKMRRPFTRPHTILDIIRPKVVDIQHDQHDKLGRVNTERLKILRGERAWEEGDQDNPDEPEEPTREQAHPEGTAEDALPTWAERTSSSGER